MRTAWVQVIRQPTPHGDHWVGRGHIGAFNIRERQYATRGRVSVFGQTIFRQD